MTRLVVVALALLLTASAHAAEPAPVPPPPDGGALPCAPLPRGQKVLVDLRDAPLTDVARLVSCALERDILFSPAALGGKAVTVISAKAVDARGLEALWQALLASNGLVAERHGAYEVVRPQRP
ncbi:MAG: hypothetical protein EP329_24885 [Deltaproteobacteria bacterium]|nr:MAG: hypothetical protein EP329_24885 [Deltaproteobacteria bacterium]